MMLHTIVRWLLLCSTVLFLAGFWNRNSLPAPSQLMPALQQAPLQKKVDLPAFGKEAGGINYRIQPLYEYELSGLVVSQYDATSWRDYLHRKSSDNLNVRDVCVIWGENARNGVYRDVEFRSGQFTCFFSTGSDEVYRLFDQTAISNNHLLTASATIQAQLSRLRIGDQIRLKGYLASYGHDHGFPFRRGTSTVRTDTGNGACETIYVESVEVIKTWMSPWRMLMYAAAAAFMLGVLAWMALPFRMKK